MKRTTVNYWVDVAIGASFAASAVSGLVFLLPLGAESVLSIPLATWDLVHVWASLAMIAGVLAHLALHWAWIAQMTRRNLAARPRGAPLGAPVAGASLGRRRFLRTAGMVALCAALPAALVRALSTGVEAAYTADAAGASGSAASSSASPAAVSSGGGATAPTDAEALPSAAPTSAPTATVAARPTQPAVANTGTVACRKGFRYDAYPGHCRLYVDKDGDGFCDYSVPS